MSLIQNHYENLLAEHYIWLFGGMEANLARFTKFFESNEVRAAKSGVALDLGAGPGFQSIPLARLGFKVTAFDLSSTLLDLLRKEAGDLPIRCVNEDFLGFTQRAPSPVELVVCMGDTLTHLSKREDVAQLIADITRILEPGGRCILSFRDMNQPLTGLDRFIPVRSDSDRIFTCFLEYGPERVLVHDLLYELQEGAWKFRKSAYYKLRLELEWVLNQLAKAGLRTQKPLIEQGMVKLIAKKPE